MILRGHPVFFKRLSKAVGCTPPKANMSPENNHDFNRKYIWINHWFSGDTRQFSGENKWLGSPAIWKGIPQPPILRLTKMPINHGFTQSVRTAGSWPARNQVSRLAPWRFSTTSNPKNLAPKKKHLYPGRMKEVGLGEDSYESIYDWFGNIWGQRTVTLHPKKHHSWDDCVYLPTPWKLAWHPKMKVWKMSSLFKQVIFRFHVNFPGCTIVVDVYGKLVGKYIYI